MAVEYPSRSRFEANEKVDYCRIWRLTHESGPRRCTVRISTTSTPIGPGSFLTLEAQNAEKGNEPLTDKLPSFNHPSEKNKTVRDKLGTQSKSNHRTILSQICSVLSTGISSSRALVGHITSIQASFGKVQVQCCNARLDHQL